jgi:type II secretory pathway pseudopilin PulG
VLPHAAALAATATPDRTLPPALAELRGFRGRIDYAAQRDGVAGAPNVVGTLIVRNGGWTLEERTNRYDLRAGSNGSSLDADGSSVIVDDILNADPLSNAWATAAGAIATQPIDSSATDTTWTIAGLRVFVDATGSRLIGISDGGSSDNVAFVLDEWSKSGALSVPGRILRLRGGVPDATFAITQYRVALAAPEKGGPSLNIPVTTLPQTQRRTILLAGPAYAFSEWAERSAAALACLLLLCAFAAVWMHRDVLIWALCKRLARDPRGWRRAGTTLFVEPDGALMFDGMKYRVGPHFYNRAALVQCSALFIRVSAPAVPRAVVLPRKFRPVDLGITRTVKSAGVRGFTLIETLLATSLFAAIVLFGIYPALVAVARADAIAAERSRAVVLTANALADEEAINEYDGGAPQGTATTTTDGLTLTVTVAPGAMRAVSDLDIRVVNADGTVLAHIVSWLGAPVKSPPNSSGGPPGE